MWISARFAAVVASTAFLLLLIAFLVPLVLNSGKAVDPAPVASTSLTPVDGAKFGEAQAALDAPERTRAQRMKVDSATGKPEGTARLDATSRFGCGAAIEPTPEQVSRLVALLKDARTVSDPRAMTAEPTFVVRFVRGATKVDVMGDPQHDRLVVSVDGKPASSFGFYGLHKEFSAFETALFPKADL